MRSDNKDETKYILKLLFTLIIAIVAVSFAYSLAKPDIYGESRLTTLDYIPVEKAIKTRITMRLMSFYRLCVNKRV